MGLSSFLPNEQLQDEKLGLMPMASEATGLGSVLPPLIPSLVSGSDPGWLCQSHCPRLTPLRTSEEVRGWGGKRKHRSPKSTIQNERGNVNLQEVNFLFVFLYFLLICQ